MTKFAEYFGINKSQAQLDFVNIDSSKDLPLFLDPYVFSKRTDLWSLECDESIASFFEYVLDSILNNKTEKALEVLKKLNEPNETCLGVSKGNPSGRGVGGTQAEAILQNLIKSKAAKTGLLEDLADCELFVEGVGPDKVSDITTNIIRNHLIKYTQAQCNLHGIEMQNDVPSGWLWNVHEKKWEQEYTKIPIIDGKKIILIPKASARWRIGFSHQEYYNDFVLSFLQAEHLKQDTALVEVLRNKRRRVTKKSLKAVHPLEKNFLADFSNNHPEVLAGYKKLMGATQEIKNSELEENFKSDIFAQILADVLLKIKPGNDEAHKFHDFMIGTLEFIFYPHLTYPEKEFEINSGRKRIDMLYTNTSSGGFFFRRRTHPKVAANKIVVECKNYTKEIANPELDQMIGRFSPSRGRLGFIIARKLDDRNRFIQRCKDTVSQDLGYILSFEDQDILEMLEIISKGRPELIDLKLEKMFDEITS